ncbi:MAG: choice-of-anchor Q domain-containing protein [Solirubrobacterales bacterium]
MFVAEPEARPARPTDAVPVARHIAALIVLVVASAALGGIPTSARADGGAVYEVPAGSADSNSGTCTETGSTLFSCSDLRAAISAADDNPGSTVKLEPGVYQLGEAHGLPSGVLAYLRVDASLTIEGAGPEVTTIEQTSGRNPIMLIPYDNTNTPWQISIEGVDLTGGVGAGHEEGEEFGAEQGGGALRINASRASGSSVTLFDDVLVGNRAEAQTAHGGAIFNRGVLNVVDTTVAHNIARAEGASSSTEVGEAAGGGIFSTGSMLIADSTIADNTAEAGGAYSKAAGGGLDSGIENFSNGAKLEVVNTTIAGNVASAGTTTNPPIVEGGGMALNRGQLTHVTLDGNVASPINAWVAWGGNLYGDADWIASSIIADGTAAEGGNCFFDNSKPNPEYELNDLEDDAVSECGFLAEYGSILGLSPQLMPLAANGGPTETMAPMPSSPVIDAGAECGWPRTIVDQRGMPRNGHCDIGAFQTQPPFATVQPEVVGAAAVGHTLTCEPGSWTGEGTLAYAYEWLREGVPSGDQTPSYTVGAGDAGAKVACRVTVSGTYGSTKATSPAVKVATPTPAAPTEITTSASTTSTSSAPMNGIARAASSATVQNNEAQVTLTCDGQEVCTGFLEFEASIAQKHMVKGYRRNRLRNIVIGTAHFSNAAGSSETLGVHLNKEGRSLLRAAGKREFKVTVKGDDIKTATLVLKEARTTSKHDAKGSTPSAQRFRSH